MSALGAIVLIVSVFLPWYEVTVTLHSTVTAGVDAGHRLATITAFRALRGALENVTILCWLLATAAGPPEELSALHGSRLEFFMTQAIDTTVRGVVYEDAVAPIAGIASASAGSDTTSAMLAGGERIVRALSERNSIPTAFVTADPGDRDGWLADARAAIASLLSRA